MNRPRATFDPSTPSRPDHTNPLRELLVRLPSLAVTPDGCIDFHASNRTLVLEIAAHAEETAQALNLGLAAVGNIWAIASPEIEDGTVPMGSVESIGWLLCVLSDCAASLLVLSHQCRRANRRRRSR